MNVTRAGERQEGEVDKALALGDCSQLPVMDGMDGTGCSVLGLVGWAVILCHIISVMVN